MLNFLAWVVSGVVLGCVASRRLAAEPDTRAGLMLNILAGVVGAYLAGLLMTPIFGALGVSAGLFSLPALLGALAGALMLLAVVNTRRRSHTERQ